MRFITCRISKMNIYDVWNFMKGISMSMEEFTDLAAVLFPLGRNPDRKKAEVLLKKARYLLRDHAGLIKEWNSVSPSEFHIEAVDEDQRQAYEMLDRKLGKYVKLVNDVKNRFSDKSGHMIRFLKTVVGNPKEVNSAGRIFKEAYELLEGEPDLLKQLSDVLELPESLVDDDMAADYFSSENLEVTMRQKRGKC